MPNSGADGMCGSHSGIEMKPVAVIQEVGVIDRILAHLRVREPDLRVWTGPTALWRWSEAPIRQRSV